MEFTGNQFKAFRNDFNQAVKEMEEKFGVTIDLGNISYQTNHFTTRLTVTNTTTKDGKSVEQAEFEQICRLYGFEPEDYNRRFRLQGEVLRLVGFNSRSPKNDAKITSEDGSKRYRCSSQAVKRNLLPRENQDNDVTEF